MMATALLEINNDTEEDLEDDTIISVLYISYNVPSFPAFTARVRAMKYEVCGEDGKKAIYHGLIRDCPKVKRIYPALASVPPGIPNAFFIEVIILSTKLSSTCFM